MEILLILWLMCAVAAGVIASSKGRSGAGYGVLGFFLGPIGVLIAAIMPKLGSANVKAGLQTGELRMCPFCDEAISSKAIKCRYCQEAVPPAERRGFWGQVIREDR